MTATIHKAIPKGRKTQHPRRYQVKQVKNLFQSATVSGERDFYLNILCCELVHMQNHCNCVVVGNNLIDSGMSGELQTLRTFKAEYKSYLCELGEFHYIFKQLITYHEIGFCGRVVIHSLTTKLCTRSNPKADVCITRLRQCGFRPANAI